MPDLDVNPDSNSSSPEGGRMTLDEKGPEMREVIPGKSPLVFDAIRLRQRARDSEARRIAEKDWDNILDERENEYATEDRKGVRKREGNLLHMAEQKTMSKVKALTFRINGDGASEDEEFVITKGLLTIADKGGLSQALKGKRGAIKDVANIGDSIIHLSVDRSNKYPIQFKNVPIDRVYIDPSADVIRGKSGVASADEVLIIYKFPYDKFLSEFSHMENAKFAAKGDLPNNEETESMHEYEDNDVESSDIEVGYYYRLSKKAFTIVAGSRATPLVEINESDGDGKYPFMKDGEPYIPIIPFHGWAKVRGYYCYGIGHLLVKEARQRRRAENWAEWGMMRNIKGLGILRLPPGMKKAKFMSQVRLANEAMKAGRDGMVVLEGNGIGENRVGMERFTSDPVTEEHDRFIGQSDLRVKRLGIPLDEIDRPASESATQTLSEEQRADAFAQEFMRLNAESFQWLWELVIDVVKEFVKDTDDTPVDMAVEVPLGMEFAKAFGKEQGLSDPEINQLAQKTTKPKVTMGMLSQALKSRHWFVQVDELSGVIKSSIRELTEIQQSLQFLQPGSPQYNSQVQKMFKIMGQDVKMQAESSPDQGQPTPPGGEGGSVPQGGPPELAAALGQGGPGGAPALA